MNRSRLKQTAAAAFACAAVAATIGIATGAAAPTRSRTTAVAGNQLAESGTTVSAGAPFPGPPGPPPGLKGGPPTFIGGPPVHSELVVPNRAGDAFVTITQDSGTVKSVSGNQLTITEGTKQATYKTVTLDIASDANVIRNGAKASLGDLQANDQVHVSQSPQSSFVFATDSAYQQKMQKQFRRSFKGLPKPGLPKPPAGMPAGPPPGFPSALMLRRGH